MQTITLEEARLNIGKKVSKTSPVRTSGRLTPKPFKSGSKFNTVKDVIMHPILNIPAYTFEEDESYVECRRCVVIPIITMMSDTHALHSLPPNLEDMLLKTDSYKVSHNVMPPDFIMVGDVLSTFNHTKND